MSVLITARGSLLTPGSLADRSPETATMVDGLFAIAKALFAIAEAIRDSGSPKHETYHVAAITHETVFVPPQRR